MSAGAVSQCPSSYSTGRCQARPGEEAARAPLNQDGGSVSPANAAALMRLPDIDGRLIGRAGLEADAFLSVVRSAL
jgi:triosephosphate isomerase